MIYIFNNNIKNMLKSLEFYENVNKFNYIVKKMHSKVE